MILSALEKNLINVFQKSFPICERPFLKVAELLKSSEDEVLAALKNLAKKNVLSRVGPVFTPRRIGESCLAALKIPSHQLEDIAEKINALDSVNHNYEREHAYNLWFVVTAADQAELDKQILIIEEMTGLIVLELPLQREFFIDLGFDIPWGPHA